MKHYNVGIIGYGWAAIAHIAAINATTQGRVTAVYSPRPLDSAELSAKHGGTIKAYQSLDAMLADPGTSSTSRATRVNIATRRWPRPLRSRT